jgi:predicted ATPase
MLALKLLRIAIDRGLHEAVSHVLGGSEGIKHIDAAADEPILLRVQLDALIWHVHLRPRGPSVDYFTEEELKDGDQLIFRRDALGGFEVGDERWTADGRLGLRAVLDARRPLPGVVRMAALLRNIAVFHDLDPYHLRTEGSNTTQTTHLHSRGHNALSMLRRWGQERAHRWRYTMVLDGLKAAFPMAVEDLDFVEAGTTLIARIYRPGAEHSVPMAHESDGLISMLIILCALATADEDGVVAFDLVGATLHPFALRVLARQAGQLSRRRNLTIIFASHNTVLIDHFNTDPSSVFALVDGVGPVVVSQMKDPEWLCHFRLGELYEGGEFGSNAPKCD